jgi:hypothetical protein
VKSGSSTLVGSEIGYHVDDAWTFKGDALNILNARLAHVEYFHSSGYRQVGSGCEGEVVCPAKAFELGITLTARF